MNALPFFRRSGAFVAALCALGAPVGAQNYEQIAPKTPPVTPAPALPESPAEAPAVARADDRLVVPLLRGLVFLPNEAAFRSEGTATEGLIVSGIPLLETAEFRALVSPVLGRPLSLRGLNRLTREVVLYFRQRGRPVVDVLVPEQNVSGGTVQVLVVEGRLGEVRVEGNRWFTAAQIAAAVRAPAGAIIEGAPLLADLAWINQNPFRQVDLVFMRGDAPGKTDVVLRTLDRFPLRVYTGYEDSGNALTGFDRVLAGVNWGNAFGRDEQLNYQFTASPDLEKLVAHSGSYIVPIARSRHTFTLYGSHAESRPTLAGGQFDLDGRSWQIGARYRIPLVARGAWTSEFTGGVDFKRSNNNLSFGGTQVFAQENDVVQAIAAFGARHTDKQGTTSGELTLALSPGGLTDGNRSRAYRAARAGARPDYAYARLDLERVTKLPASYSWIARGTAQLASANLLGSEQLGLGGSVMLRGYEEREANGDNGFVLSNELHAPPVQFAGKSGATSRRDRFDPFVFLDYGLVTSHQPLPGESRRLTLASAGVGFRYSLGGNLNVRAGYGWQLKESGVSDGRREHRGHLSMVLAY